MLCCIKLKTYFIAFFYVGLPSLLLSVGPNLVVIDLANF